ncbi:helix-turn-helix domain-containing protein [Streptomyces sp. NPDC051079]|uniref:helix-turn-helix domain-containing protein n=1 Tax=Streptomyces sp. NPDC051079 TaxID=3155043 RepID=UPI00344B7632
MTRHASAAQRHRAVREVLAGRPVAEVARRHGVSRQTLYAWRKRYAAHGEGGLADRSRRPHESPARIPPAVEALICSLRERHPGWGAGRLRAALDRLGVPDAPSRTTIHRVLIRNRLLVRPDPAAGEELGGLIAAAREALRRLGAALDGLEAEAEAEAAGGPGEPGAGVRDGLGDGLGEGLGEGLGDGAGAGSRGRRGAGPSGVGPSEAGPSGPAAASGAEPTERASMGPTEAASGGHPGEHTDGHVGGHVGGLTAGPVDGPCGTCAVCTPPVRLFEQASAPPASTISRYGTLIPTPREVGRRAGPLTETVRCGSEG